MDGLVVEAGDLAETVLIDVFGNGLAVLGEIEARRELPYK
jgi:hypothetical protein